MSAVVKTNICKMQCNEVQEVPLTLRGKRGRCRNITGERKYMKASLAQGHGHFFSGCGFMVGLGKPKLCAKFEVPSFSRCVNIEVQPQHLRELP